MKVQDFDYSLPEELVAQEPLAERDESRMLVLHRLSGEVEHRSFRDLPEYVRPGDVVVLNNSKVIRARLFGRKKTGARVEVLLLSKREDSNWEALVRPGQKIPTGTTLVFAAGLVGEVLARTPAGGRIIRFEAPMPVDEAIERVGEVPTPPYIKKRLADPDRYQTVYADEPGSAAAPTAGLHFTQMMLERVRAAGAQTVCITLHVGLGTFRPVRALHVEEHKMHEEHFEMSEPVARTIREAKASGGRVLAIGTTVTRTLESSLAADGSVAAGEGWTSLFIYPGHRFKAVDMLLTNFHLPKSTLLMLVSALAGRERILAAYDLAVDKRYRFFSFGDAMLIID
jgi:S-adenosylmethionine:tRNA ribosyltransferase-isomerase